MRFSTFCLICSYALLQTVVVRCTLKSESVDTVIRVLARISADDGNWFNILKQDVRLDHRKLDPSVIDMLDEMNMKATAIRVHRVLSYLVGRLDVTGTQTYFGVDVIGAGLSCQFMNTVLKHMYFTYVYGQGPHADESAIQSCLSMIQVAMAGYMDKLIAFDYPIGPFVRMNRMINMLFNAHDEKPSETTTGSFISCIERLLGEGRKLLAAQCPQTNGQETVRKVKVTRLNDYRFWGRPRIDERQLLKMIKDVDEYQFVEITWLSEKFWMQYLSIRPNAIQQSELPIQENSNDDDVVGGNTRIGGANYNNAFNVEL